MAVLRLAESHDPFIFRVLRKLVQRLKELTCSGHELYLIRNNPTKLYQECLLCGYRTNGWMLDPRNRRMHVVKHERRAV